MYALFGIRLLICRIKYVVVAVIVWFLDLQLPMQSVPITTDCEFESWSGQGVQNYLIEFVSDLRQIGGFLRVLHQ